MLVDGDFTVAESTSILRYIGQMPGGEAWYGGRSVREKVKIDEYLDFWQSTLHPNVIKLVQNKLMYKVLIDLIGRVFDNMLCRWCSESLSLTRRRCPRARQLMRLTRKCLKITSSGPTSLLEVTLPVLPTFSWPPPFSKPQWQVRFSLTEVTTRDTILGSPHDSLAEYLEEVKAATEPAFYEELKGEVENIPTVLKSMKML